MIDVVDAVMKRKQDFRGTVFDVTEEMAPGEAQPIVFGGHAELGLSVEEAMSMLGAVKMSSEVSAEVIEEAERAVSAAEARSAKRQVTFVTTTTGKDRHGTRIRTDGINTANYERNPVFVWGHDAYGGWEKPDMESVIGRCVGIRKGLSSMEQDFEFCPEEVNPKGDRAYRMVLAKFLSATSIGFIPRKVVIEVENERDVPVIVEAELLEVSLVTIPSNPEVAALVREMAKERQKVSEHESLSRKVPMGALEGVLTDEQRAEIDKFIEARFKDLDFSSFVQKTPPANAADIGVVQADAVRHAFGLWAMRGKIRSGLGVC